MGLGVVAAEVRAVVELELAGLFEMETVFSAGDGEVVVVAEGEEIAVLEGGEGRFAEAAAGGDGHLVALFNEAEGCAIEPATDDAGKGGNGLAVADGVGVHGQQDVAVGEVVAADAARATRYEVGAGGNSESLPGGPGLGGGIVGGIGGAAGVLACHDFVVEIADRVADAEESAGFGMPAGPVIGDDDFTAVGIGAAAERLVHVRLAPGLAHVVGADVVEGIEHVAALHEHLGHGHDDDGVLRIAGDTGRDDARAGMDPAMGAVVALAGRSEFNVEVDGKSGGTQQSR
jgi:hypothetical protein